MQSKKKLVKTAIRAVRREIPADKSVPEIQPGEIGAAAVAAAALHQLNRCAKEIEEFVEASKMERIIDEMQKDLRSTSSEPSPRLRLHRD